MKLKFFKEREPQVENNFYTTDQKYFQKIRNFKTRDNARMYQKKNNPSTKFRFIK